MGEAFKIIQMLESHLRITKKIEPRNPLEKYENHENHVNPFRIMKIMKVLEIY